LRVVTVSDWLDQFVKGKRKAKATMTAKRHEQIKREFIEFLGHRARLNIAAITSKDILDFRDYREGKGLTPTTLNLDVGILSSAFNAALKQGLIPVNPCAAIEPLKNKRQRKHTFTAEQVTALLRKASGDWRGLILVGFYTGQRLHDCADLRWRDIDLVSEIKTIRFEPSKTGGDVIAVIPAALEDYLLSLPTAKSDDEFLFPTLAQRKVSDLSREFRRIMDAARIEQRVISERGQHGRRVFGLSFHSLRHTFSSILANAGVSEEMRAALTGHKSREQHRHYTHHELRRLHDAVALLPALR
jgi:integrase